MKGPAANCVIFYKLTIKVLLSETYWQSLKDMEGIFLWMVESLAADIWKDSEELYPAFVPNS